MSVRLDNPQEVGMDRFEAMRALLCVIDTGSFTKAADHLGMSRANVSALIQQLESHLRVRLLHRTTRRLSLTVEGQAYCLQARGVLHALEMAESSVNMAIGSERGRLRVDVPSPFATALLLPALADFQLKHPQIEIALGVSDRAVDLALAQVDCVVRSDACLSPDLVARTLAVLPMGLYAAPAYLDRCGQPGDPQSLAKPPHWQVCFGFGADAVPWQLTRGREAVTVNVRSRLSVDDGNACLEAARAGLGIALMPCYMTADSVAAGTLVPVLVDWQPTPMQLYLAWSGQRPVNARLRAFIDWMLSCPGLGTAAGGNAALTGALR